MNWKNLGHQVMRIHRGRAIVKSWGKKVNMDDVCYGPTEVFYDVCEYVDGDLGHTFESFVSFRAAVKYLYS